MPKILTEYNLLFSCPGDAYKECYTVVEKVIDDFNKYTSQSLSIRANLIHWSTDSYPQSGGHPQNLLNTQLIDTADAAIAIFWTRFGTPTDEYASGTEEEIERMINNNKQVFLYFLDKAVSPSETDTNMYQEQRKKIIEFREKYEKKGLYCVVADENVFKEQFSKHLFIYFAKQIDKDNDVFENKSNNLQKKELVIKGVNESISLLEAPKERVSVSEIQKMEVSSSKYESSNRATNFFWLKNNKYDLWINIDNFTSNIKAGVRHYFFVNDDEIDILILWLSSIAKKNSELLPKISRNVEIRILEGGTINTEFIIFNGNTNNPTLLIGMQNALSNDEKFYQVQDKDIYNEITYKIFWLADHCKAVNIDDYFAAAVTTKITKFPREVEILIQGLMKDNENFE